MECEKWSLGTATATIELHTDRLAIELRGIVTAPAYEALHLQLGRVASHRRILTISDCALIVASPRSLVEAAIRGTPLRQMGPGHAVVITVRAWRARWAFEHCALMTAAGLFRAAAVPDLLGSAMA